MLWTLPSEVANAVAKAATRSEGRQFTDPRRLVKPPRRRSDEPEFDIWSRKTENCILSVHTESVCLTRVAAEPDQLQNNEAPSEHDRQRGDERNPRSGLRGVHGSHSEHIVSGTGEEAGFEAWRRLNRLYDFLAAGRSRVMLRENSELRKEHYRELATQS